MIRNEREYQEAVKRVSAERERLGEHERAWLAKGIAPAEVAEMMEPLRTFHLQLAEEVESYERLKRGQFDDFENFHGLGELLIGLRISLGITQTELANRLGVDESTVSRDERNEYHGITMERANRVVEALGVRLTTTVNSLPMRKSAAGEHTEARYKPAVS